MKEVPGSRRTIQQIDKAGNKTGLSIHEVTFEGRLSPEDRAEVLNMNEWPKNFFGWINRRPKFFEHEEDEQIFTTFYQETKIEL